MKIETPIKRITEKEVLEIRKAGDNGHLDSVSDTNKTKSKEGSYTIYTAIISYKLYHKNEELDKIGSSIVKTENLDNLKKNIESAFKEPRLSEYTGTQNNESVVTIQIVK